MNSCVHVVNLDEWSKDPDKQDKWIVGTEPDVKKCSPWYSEHVQIRYRQNHQAKGEKLHWHYPSAIDEYYLVTDGRLSLQVGEQKIQLQTMDMVKVGANTPHRVLRSQDRAKYVVIRAPISTDDTKADVSRLTDSILRIKAGRQTFDFPINEL